MPIRPPETIAAAAMLLPEDGVIENAERVANAVLAALDRGSNVRLDFSGLRGIPSSFYNVIFVAVVDRYGAGALDSKLDLVTDSPLQRTVLEKSLHSLRSVRS